MVVDGLPWLVTSPCDPVCVLLIRECVLLIREAVSVYVGLALEGTMKKCMARCQHRRDSVELLQAVVRTSSLWQQFKKNGLGTYISKNDSRLLTCCHVIPL